MQTPGPTPKANKAPQPATTVTNKLNRLGDVEEEENPGGAATVETDDEDGI